VAGTDYTKTSGTLTFGPGQTVENISVPIIDRAGAAPTRSFGITLSSPSNAVITEGSGVVTIGASGSKAVSSPNISAPPNLVGSEADGYVDMPVTLSAPSTNTVTVNYSLPGGGCNTSTWMSTASGTPHLHPGPDDPGGGAGSSTTAVSLGQSGSVLTLSGRLRRHHRRTQHR